MSECGARVANSHAADCSESNKAHNTAARGAAFWQKEAVHFDKTGEKERGPAEAALKVSFALGGAEETASREESARNEKACSILCVRVLYFYSSDDDDDDDTAAAKPLCWGPRARASSNIAPNQQKAEHRLSTRKGFKESCAALLFCVNCLCSIYSGITESERTHAAAAPTPLSLLQAFAAILNTIHLRILLPPL